MQNLIRLLVRLYPDGWRERYGDEFEALLGDIHLKWTDLFDVLKGGLTMRLTRLNPVTVAIFALVGGIGALAAAYATPNTWRSEAIVHVLSSDSRPLPDVVAELSRRVFTKASLADLITRNDLYPQQRARQPMEDVIETAKKNIQIRAIKNDPNSFQVAFVYSDPQVAQRVANWLLNTFVEANLRLAEERVERSGPPPEIARISIDVPASLPNSPAGPNLPAAIASGVAGGAVLGILIAWIARRRRNAIVG